jgi:hypothetical protein
MECFDPMSTEDGGGLNFEASLSKRSRIDKDDGGQDGHVTCLSRP